MSLLPDPQDEGEFYQCTDCHKLFDEDEMEVGTNNDSEEVSSLCYDCWEAYNAI